MRLPVAVAALAAAFRTVEAAPPTPYVPSFDPPAALSPAALSSPLLPTLEPVRSATISP